MLQLSEVVQLILIASANAAQPAPASVVPAWATALSDQLTRMETMMTKASDDIAQLRGDNVALTAAFTGYQGKVATDLAAATAKAADLQTQLDAAKAAAASAAAADPEAIPVDVQTALDAAHAASQALTASMTGLTATVAAPTAPVADPAPAAPVVDPVAATPVADPATPVATPPVDTTAQPVPVTTAPAAPDAAAPTGTPTAI